MTRCFFRVFALSTILASSTAFAQNQFNAANDSRTPLPSVAFLKVAPDARASGMGDAGVATSPDVNSTFWNPAKLAMMDKDMGASFSYTPWLRQLVNDMAIYYLTGYKKIGKNQAIGVSVNYFDMGMFEARTANGSAAGDYYSRDFAAALSYSMKLTSKMSAGIGLRYINSNPAGSVIVNNVALKPGTTVAGDISLYYNPYNPDRKLNWAYGLNISNIGGQVSYGTDKNSIPTNFRIGTAATYQMDEYNKLVFALDLNKLMVPTPPKRDATGKIIAGKDPKTLGVIEGMLGSFSDAPDGMSEEMKEVAVSSGVEYWYNNLFSARLGYHYENPEKSSNQTYLSAGLGFKIQNKYALDFSYLMPQGGQNNPLANTLRLSLVFNLDKKDRMADIEDDAK
jgi:Type IX secretion system protein PorV